MPLMNGTEHFSVNGRKIDIAVSDFWKWAYSDLSNILNRSMLAKYIVASSLESVGNKVSRSKLVDDPYDLVTKDGLRIEIKSAAYVQSQDADRPDCISFGITRSGLSPQKTSDVYVFCIYKGMSETDSPLNLDAWDFYVIAAKTINEKKPTQKTITLPSLMKLEPIWCDYYGIGEAIRAVISA